MRRFTLVFAALVFTSTPALADWQKTRWGNTPSEVEVVSGLKFAAGGPQHESPNDPDTIARAPYSAGPFQFSAGFQFTAGLLSAVHLTLVGGGTCADLLGNLTSNYGRPVSEKLRTPTEVVWLDTTQKNRVVYKALDRDFCMVSYFPLKTAASPGL